MWYSEIKQIYSAREDASAEAYLARIGVPEATISYVTTLPPELKRKVVGLLSRSPHTTVENIMEQLRTPVEMQKQPVVAPPTPNLDARFNNPQEKQQFFSRIPKEYAQWVTRILNEPNFAFIPSEDAERLLTALKGFTNLKVRDNIPLEKDINKYKGLLQLEETVAKFTGTGPKSGGYLQYNPLSLPGVEQVKTLKDGTLMYKVHNADSVKKLGLGTKWCTREDYYGCQADRYIKEYGYLYLFTKDSKPILQMTPDLNQVMDINDRQVPLPRDLYGDFAQQLSKKSGVPVKTIKMFADENKANDPNLILKAVRENGKALQFASDEIRNNPKIVVEALKQNGDAFQYASQDLQDSEAFTAEASRIEGNFNYSLGYNDMDDEMEQILYGGAKEFGLEPTLVKWDFQEAYDAVSNVVEKGRDSRGRDAHGVAPILASAAYDADFQRIRAGKFDVEPIKKKAFMLALAERKNPQTDYDKVRPEYRQQLIAPYLEQARIEVINGLKQFDNLNKVSPRELEDRVQRKAWYNMKEERTFDSTKVKSLEDLDLSNQQRFIAKAIDSSSEIASIYERRQDNEEKIFDNYFDDYDYGYGEEPDEGDFESPEEFQSARDEWQESIDKARDEAADDYRRDNFPFNFDSSIIESFEKIIESKPIKYPSWIYKYFAKGSSHRPTILWSVEGIKRKKAEEAKRQKMQAKPKKKLRRASGWYNLLKLSESFLAQKITDIYAITFDEAKRSDLIEDGNKIKTNKDTFTFADENKMICRDDDYNIWVEDIEDFNKRYKIKNGKKKQIRSPFKEGFWQRYEPTEKAVNIIEDVSEDEVLLKSPTDSDEWKISREEYEKNYKKKRKDEILLNEWSEEREISKEANANPNISIDSDLHGFDFKDDGDLIRIEAYDNKRGFVVGHLNYYMQGDTLQIEMISVGDEYKRQGIATQLIEKMKQDHPGFRIEPGLVTHQGQPFFKNLKQRKII